uniref:Uncharacterized protein n=1 Tax=uncultured marine virus TaxID=186617 RepID=A0A0F7L991_9VIRU|nr:hypothetical protein [uncultured marine virus]
MKTPGERIRTARPPGVASEPVSPKRSELPRLEQPASNPPPVAVATERGLCRRADSQTPPLLLTGTRSTRSGNRSTTRRSGVTKKPSGRAIR